MYLMVIGSDRTCLFKFHIISGVIELWCSCKKLEFNFPIHHYHLIVKPLLFFQILKSNAATLRMNIPKIIDIFRPLKQPTPVD